MEVAKNRGGVFVTKFENKSRTHLSPMILQWVGTVGYMYDRVSGQLLGNSGSGNFIVGPDI